jgi:hypothetical protein
MADEEKRNPFARPLPSPTGGGPSPFARPPAPRAVPAAGAVATLTPTAAPPLAQRVATPPAAANLPMAALAGLVAAAVGAALWAGVTVLTGYQIGWMAVGVGAMVGVAVRTAGRGTTKAFGILGAVLALGGCLVGNFLTGVVVLSRHWDISFATFFTRLTPELTSRMMTAMFSPLDLLFYALALWQGYKFAIVATTE